MNILGTWYVQPGDIPADFVWPVTLNPDGFAIFEGAHSSRVPYGIARGTLFIGKAGGTRWIFPLPANEAEALGGLMETRHEPEPGAPEDEGVLHDCAALLRHPGSLRIEWADAPTLQNVAPEEQLELPELLPA